MSIIDLSLPLSDVLREGTKKAHEEVEVSPAAAAMLRGELDKEEYIRFLMMLWHIYKYIPSFHAASELTATATAPSKAL